MTVYINGIVNLEATNEANLEASKRATAVANQHYGILLTALELLNAGNNKEATSLINSYLVESDEV
jgi:hypothetical protein